MLAGQQTPQESGSTSVILQDVGADTAGLSRASRPVGVSHECDRPNSSVWVFVEIGESRGARGGRLNAMGSIQMEESISYATKPTDSADGDTTRATSQRVWNAGARDTKCYRKRLNFRAQPLSCNVPSTAIKYPGGAR